MNINERPNPLNFINTGVSSDDKGVSSDDNVDHISNFINSEVSSDDKVELQKISKVNVKEMVEVLEKLGLESSQAQAEFLYDTAYIKFAKVAERNQFVDSDSPLSEFYTSPQSEKIDEELADLRKYSDSKTYSNEIDYQETIEGIKDLFSELEKEEVDPKIADELKKLKEYSLNIGSNSFVSDLRRITNRLVTFANKLPDGELREKLIDGIKQISKYRFKESDKEEQEAMIKKTSKLFEDIGLFKGNVPQNLSNVPQNLSSIPKPKPPPPTDEKPTTTST